MSSFQQCRGYSRDGGDAENHHQANGGHAVVDAVVQQLKYLDREGRGPALRRHDEHRGRQFADRDRQARSSQAATTAGQRCGRAMRSSRPHQPVPSVAAVSSITCGTLASAGQRISVASGSARTVCTSQGAKLESYSQASAASGESGG